MRDMAFTPYTDIVGNENHVLASTVARHHIDDVYNPDGPCETPLFDSIFDFQFDAETKKVGTLSSGAPSFRWARWTGGRCGC